MVLPLLRPGEYTLQLQAIAFWGKKRLLGARAELRFSAGEGGAGAGGVGEAKMRMGWSLG